MNRRTEFRPTAVPFPAKQVGETESRLRVLGHQLARLGWELKRAGMDWQGWLLTRWGITGKRRLVAQLKADPSLGSEAERVRAFIAQQGGCRATYYNHARRLGRPLEPPELQLKHLPPDWTPDAAVSLLDLLRRRFGTLGGDQPP